MKNKYRIIEVSFSDGSTRYAIQKQTRLFWLGPLIWETYQTTEYGYDWSYFLSSGDTFTSLDWAKERLSFIMCS